MLNNLRRRGARILRAFAWWILATVHPSADEVSLAIAGAFADCGLPIEAAKNEDFDLVQAGKLHEVLYHTSHRLGNPLTTVGNLRDLLSE